MTNKTNVAYGLLIAAFALTGLLAPLAANAVDTTYTPLAPLPCIPGNGITCPKNGDLQPVPTVDVQQYIQYAFNLLIALAAVAAVFMIVWGGFEYMTSDAVQNKTEGRKKAVNAVSGLILVLCSYLILRTINPQFVNIPSSLVTPLNLTSSNISNSWMTQLQTEASKFSTQSAQSKQQALDLINQNNALQSDMNSLASKISDELGGGNPSDICGSLQIDPTLSLSYPDISGLCDQWQKDQNAMQENVNAGNVLIAQEKFSSYALGAIKQNDYTAQSLVDLKTTYDNASSQLKSSGATTDQRQSLTNTYNNTDGQIRLIEIGNSTNSSNPNIATALNDFSAVVNTDIPGITDSNQSQLAQTANQAMDQFAKNYYAANKSLFTSDVSKLVTSATTPQDKLNALKKIESGG